MFVLTVDQRGSRRHGDRVAALHAAGAVLNEEFLPEGTKVRARLREDQAGRLDIYRIGEPSGKRALTDPS